MSDSPKAQKSESTKCASRIPVDNTMASLTTMTTRSIRATAIQRYLHQKSCASIRPVAALLFTPTLSQPIFTIPSPSSLLGTLWESILRAVPKKKTSHSKKRMRASNKGLEDRKTVGCPGCGRQKLPHHLCAHCFVEMRKEWKQNKRGDDLLEA